MKQIPMLDLKLEYKYMKKDIDSAIKKCLENQKWIFGPEIKELEQKISEYIGVKHCIGVSSGTESLVLSLRALAIKLKGREYFDRSDEIITTPFTFTATGDAILRSGATPIFVDIDPVTCNINPENITKYLKNSSSNKKVAGLVPVHLYGQSCRMDEIMKIAEEHDLFVVEDAAQAFGAMWNGQKLGSIGATGAFSFFPSKSLGGYGDGGMVATDDDEIAELVQMLIRHGGKDKYNVEHIGYNARLDTIHAAVLIAKIKYIDEFNECRKQTAAIYNNELQNINGFSIPLTDSSSSASHIYHQYTLSVQNNKRDSLQNYLKEQGVSSMVYYPYTLHKMKVFNNGLSRVSGELNHAESACRSVLSLPVGPLQKKKDTAFVINRVKKFIETI